jgi:hypothetical protein
LWLEAILAAFAAHTGRPHPIANNDINAVGIFPMSRFKHRVGLANAGGIAEEDLQLAARRPGRLTANAGEKLIMVGSVLDHLAVILLEL